MLKPLLSISISLLTACSLAATTACDWFDWGVPAPAVADAPANTTLGQSILDYAGEPISRGRLLFNSRLRYEYASQQGLDQANAFTLRTRVGYETARYHGFWGLAEFENTWAINYTDYGAFPPPNNNGKTVIADPRNNELNRLFLAYNGYNSSFKGGRQIIALDNQRFVGPVGWRQNDQTFDAVRATTEVVRDFWLSYAWNWRVNRVFGVYAPNPNLRRFDSNNHFVNLHYKGLEHGTVGTYFYYLDLDGAAALSGSTVGAFYEVNYPLDEAWSLLGRAEYAFQTDNAATGNASFWENYYHVRLGVAYDGMQAGFGFENLGGNGTRAFQTPLATLHGFNGWADVFLVTPNDGLRDYYLWLQATRWQFTGRVELHYFTAQRSGQGYGREVDVSLSRPINENLSVTTKFAYYNGLATAGPGISPDRLKFWIQLDFQL